MIRINLLPPELRKRQGGGVQGDQLAVGALALVALAFALGWAWLHFARIPYAERHLTEVEAELVQATAEADEARALDAEIQQFEKRLVTLRGLINSKMRWAATLNDFVDLMARDEWRVPGFQIACGNLSIDQAKQASTSRSRRSSAKESIRFKLSWDMQLVGADFQRNGDYVYAFFQDMAESAFWSDNGFVDRPMEPYRGDRPEQEEDIDRVVVSHRLEWYRDKQVEEQRRAAKSELAAKTSAPAERGR
ncbi:MAG: hypothetical protein ACYTF0_04350 [Planctomycetota bacterium]|jgi:hypothetical protein